MLSSWYVSFSNLVSCEPVASLQARRRTLGDPKSMLPREGKAASSGLNAAILGCPCQLISEDTSQI